MLYQNTAKNKGENPPGRPAGTELITVISNLRLPAIRSLMTLLFLKAALDVLIGAANAGYRLVGGGDSTREREDYIHD